MITNDEHVRIWKKSVLAHPTILHLPVKTQETCIMKGLESRYCTHELVVFSVPEHLSYILHINSIQ
jgi:hypothetical protein